jgi:hypothetical protein
MIYLGAELLEAEDLGAVDAELVVGLHNGETTGGYWKGLLLANLFSLKD